MNLDKNKIRSELEEKTGYSFKDEKLLYLSLSHSSYANEQIARKTEHNERIEFLGDAVLEIVSSDYLYRNYSDMSEGDMSKKRAALVCEPSLAFCARELELGKYLLLGKGEDMSGGRERDSILSDAMESLIGAIYLDSGLESAREFIMKFILKDIDDRALFYDSKTILQEKLQKEHRGPISYELIGTKGPDHNRIFIMELRLGDEVLATGEGHSKQAAGQEAAYKAILAMKQREDLKG